MASFEQKAKKRIVKSTQLPQVRRISLKWPSCGSESLSGSDLKPRVNQNRLLKLPSLARGPGTKADSTSHRSRTWDLRSSNKITHQLNASSMTMPISCLCTAKTQSPCGQAPARPLESLKLTKCFHLMAASPFRAIVPWLSLAGQCNGWIKWVKTESTPSH